VVSQLKPRVIIPMHFKTQDVSLPIAPVDDFIERMGGGEELNSCFVEITPETLPVDQKIIVLKYK
jgi:L-ascorbate metabolism protein UlaG (beta-lactamase superfamily)